MEQKISKKKHSFLKVLGVFILAAITINLLIGLIDRIDPSLPYVATIITISLVTLACAYFILKYASGTSYIILEDGILFARVIGKRYFEIIRIDKEQISSIKLAGGGKKKLLYDLTEENGNTYILTYRDREKSKDFYIGFSPDGNFLRELKIFVKS